MLDRHRLGGEKVADLSRADAERDCSEGTVGGGVRVAAGDRRPGLGNPLLRPDDVNNPLFPRSEIEVGDTEFVGVLLKLLDHCVGQRIFEGFLSLVGGDDVVDSGEGAVRVFYLEAKIPEHTEGLRAGDLVDEVGSDEELGLAIGQCADAVRVPNFFEQAFSHRSGW